jgi:hypothetical protein
MNRGYWLLLTTGAAGAVAATFPLAGADADLGLIICAFLVVTVFIILVTVALYGTRRPVHDCYLPVALMACVYVLTAWSLLCGPVCDSIRTRELYRWLLWSNRYGKHVLAQPVSSIGNHKSIEWDRWGYADSSAVAYLVYDPSDNLRLTMQVSASERAEDFPCRIERVDRLGSRWYSVVLLIGKSENRCN